MKKRTALLGLTAALALTATACGAKTAEETATTAATAAETTAEETTEAEKEAPAEESESTGIDYAAAFAELSEENPMIVDEENQVVHMLCDINGKYFTESTGHGIVFKDGGNKDISIFRGYADEVDFYHALEDLGAKPGNNLTMDDMNAGAGEGKTTEGDKIEAVVTWDGQSDPLPLEDVLKMSTGTPLDLRFSGNLENAEKYNSGCVVCLSSCCVGIVSNAANPTGTWNDKNATFHADESVLPGDGEKIMVSFLLPGAGKAANTKTAAEPLPDLSGIELTMMVPDWGNPGEELLARFEEETGCKVNVTEVSWDDIRDKISIAAAGGQAAADVFEVDWSWVGEMNSAGWLAPIEMTEEDIADEPTLETFTIDGKILALPYANDYRIAYYNKDHFEQAGITEAPKTWDEVEAAMKAIKEAGICEYPYSMPMNADESATTSLTWLSWAKNGVVFNDDGTFNKEAVLDALTFENKMVTEGYVDPAMRTADGMTCYNKICSGETSFMVGPTKFVNFISNPEKTAEDVLGNVEAILLPGKDDVSDRTMPLPEAYGVSAFSENQEAAITFVKWLNSAEIEKELYLANGSIPNRNSVIEEMINDGTIKTPGAMLEQAKLIKSPFPNGVPDYYAEMTNAMYNNINQMVLGNQTPEEAFDAMDQKVKELLQ